MDVGPVVVNAAVVAAAFLAGFALTTKLLATPPRSETWGAAAGGVTVAVGYALLRPAEQGYVAAALVAVTAGLVVAYVVWYVVRRAAGPGRRGPLPPPDPAGDAGGSPEDARRR